MMTLGTPACGEEEDKAVNFPVNFARFIHIGRGQLFSRANSPQNDTASGDTATVRGPCKDASDETNLPSVAR